jgi:nucleotidyltransferase/DNA polymerase involved in DNA repair
MARYHDISRKIMTIFRTFTPLVEPLSVDEAFLDVSGSLRGFESPLELAGLLKRRIRDEVGLNVSIGVAPNKFLAKLASDLEKPDGLTLVPFEQNAIVGFLQPLPVCKIWGVGRKTEARLKALGIKLVKDLQMADDVFLAGVLGERLAGALKRLAFGLDCREVETVSMDKSVSNELTLNEDCTDRQVLRKILGELVDKVAWRLRLKGLKGRTLRLKLRYADFSNFSRQVTLGTHSDVTAVFRREMFGVFDALEVTRPVRLIGFGVAGFDGDMLQQPQLDFGGEDENLSKERELDKSMDYIRKNFGQVKRGL